MNKVRPCEEDPELGVVPDTVLAKKYNIDKRLIRKARVRKNIPTQTAKKRKLLEEDPDLGAVSDRTLAIRHNVDKSLVRLARVKKGIPPFSTIPKNSPWESDADLGQIFDWEVAEKYGVSEEIIRKARIKKNIPSKRSSCPWREDSDLGNVPDSFLAEKYGVGIKAIEEARQTKKIPPFRDPGKFNGDWDQVLLGQMTDQHLADILNMSKTAVRSERNKRGIKPYSRKYLTIEGEYATYPEAIIDLYLHTNNIPHKFQYTLKTDMGTFKVDWLVDGVIWEYLGCWDHALFGESYRQQYEEKKFPAFQQAGYRVKKIYPDQIEEFKQGIDLKQIYTLSEFICGRCGRGGMKHGGRGLCHNCNRKRREEEEIELAKGNPFVCTKCKSTDPKRHSKELHLCRSCYQKQQRKSRLTELQLQVMTDLLNSKITKISGREGVIGTVIATLKDRGLITCHKESSGIYRGELTPEGQEFLLKYTSQKQT